MAKRQRNIEVSDDSYIDEITHGSRSHYVRAVVDAHLSELSVAVARLLSSHTADEVSELVAQADMPRRTAPLDIDMLRGSARSDACALANEAEMTGIDVDELIRLLKEGTRC